MLRAGSEKLNWTVDTRRGQLEGVVEDHRKGDFCFGCHEAHPDARLRIEAEGDEHDCMLLVALATPSENRFCLN
ncbi:hypothetical protein NL676_032228 [Syzygium grande]|nr:hypothetical protein NL676_032228 [Syzygium grande]